MLSIAAHFPELKSSFKSYSKSRSEWGVLLASAYLKRRGYKITRKSDRTTGIEIDIVATRGKAVLLVEVKAVSHANMLERIKRSRQIQRLRNAQSLLQEKWPSLRVHSELFVLEGEDSFFVIDDFLC